MAKRPTRVQVEYAPAHFNGRINANVPAGWTATRERDGRVLGQGETADEAIAEYEAQVGKWNVHFIIDAAPGDVDNDGRLLD